MLADLPFAKLLDFSRGHALLGLQQLRRHAQQQVRFPLEADRRPDGPRQLVGRLPRAVDRRAVRRPGRLVPDPQRPVQHRPTSPNQIPAAQARCLAEGVPAGGYEQDNPQIRITVGGNPNLLPENVRVHDLRLRLQPELGRRPGHLAGLVEDQDRGRDHHDRRRQRSSSSASTPAAPARPARCTPVSPDGNIITLLNTTTNIGGTEVEGYDLTVGYRLPETAWGKFSFTWDTTYLAKQETTSTATALRRRRSWTSGDRPAAVLQRRRQPGRRVRRPEPDNNWRIRSNLATRWEMGDLGATWNVRYYSRRTEACQAFEDYGYGFLCTDTDRVVGVPTDTNSNGVWDGDGRRRFDRAAAGGASTTSARPRTTTSASYWNAPWNAKITLGVNNVFDKNPPIALTRSPTRSTRSTKCRAVLLHALLAEVLIARDTGPRQIVDASTPCVHNQRPRMGPLSFSQHRHALPASTGHCGAHPGTASERGDRDHGCVRGAPLSPARPAARPAGSKPGHGAPPSAGMPGSGRAFF